MFLDKISKDKKVPEESNEKKSTPTTSTKAKVEILGESTTDKDTEDEAEKKETSKPQSDSSKEDIEKITGDLQLSEDDSDSTPETGEEKSNVSKSLPEKTESADNSDKPVSNTAQETKTENETIKDIIATENAPAETEKVEESTKETESDNTSKEISDENQNVNSEIKNESDEKEKDVTDSNSKPDEAAQNKVEDLIEVEDTDDYLLYLEDILKSIHKSYYEAYDAVKDKEGAIPDLKVIIPDVKQKVLKGCNLVFSGLVPSHIPLHQSRAYMVAISLGATVSADVSANCTHLVAARPGTAKVNSSRRFKGIQIVTPLWLWHCAERWERLDERLYPLGKNACKIFDRKSLK